NANGKATREVMAAFMIRMLGIDASQYSYVDLADKYADADQISAWAVPSMKAAVALEIFVGAKNGDAYYLNPKSNITRQEYAVVFVKAIKADDIDVKAFALGYKDAASIASWARTYVKIISKLGYMQGSDGKFYPKDQVTRAEIIQTIYNYMY
ncbi:MAG: S-layer homology domain-containing protein, partial [Clostridia bacterium]|nr:S-layer homology domain-containing protein [Clostridia bacterium]